MTLIDLNKVISFKNNEKIDIDKYDLFIVTGWSKKYWRNIVKEAKKRNKKTCVVVDNNWRASARQIFGMVYFRMFYRKLYDFAFFFVG